MAAQRWAKPSETVGSNDTQIVSVSVVAVSALATDVLPIPGSPRSTTGRVG